MLACVLLLEVPLKPPPPVLFSSIGCSTPKSLLRCLCFSYHSANKWIWKRIHWNPFLPTSASGDFILWFLDIFNCQSQPCVVKLYYSTASWRKPDSPFIGLVTRVGAFCSLRCFTITNVIIGGYSGSHTSQNEEGNGRNTIIASLWAVCSLKLLKVKPLKCSCVIGREEQIHSWRWLSR